MVVNVDSNTLGSDIPNYNQKTKGIFFAFICLFLLGWMPIITNGRPDSLDSFTFTFYLSFWQVVAALPLLTYEPIKGNHGIFSKGTDREYRIKTYGVVFGTGLIFLASTFLYVFSFEKAGTIPAAIAMQAYPLFATILEAIFLKKLKSKSELFFMSTLVVGIYYLGTKGTWLIENFSIWFGIALVVPLLWSIAHITIRHTISNSPITPNQITFFRVLTALLVLSLFGFTSNRSSFLIDNIWKLSFQIFAFAMGVVYYIELVSWFNAIKHIEVSVASSITTAAPLVTLILAVIFLKEVVLIYQILSLLIVSFSLYGLIIVGKRKK